MTGAAHAEGLAGLYAESFLSIGVKGAQVVKASDFAPGDSTKGKNSSACSAVEPRRSFRLHEISGRRSLTGASLAPRTSLFRHVEKVYSRASC
jgi:hypothetical protein